MNPIHTVWLASSVGAILFFMCGYFLARSRLTPAGMVPTKGRYDPGGPTQKEFAAKLADMQRRARRESAELESQLAASNREREELRKRRRGRCSP